MDTIIQVSCIDQSLRLLNTPKIASGGVKEDYIQFEFCGMWDGYAKTAVFFRDRELVYYVVLDDTGKGVVPWEVLTDPGEMSFAVYGVKDEVVRTSEIMKYTIVEGAITSDTVAPEEPSPTVVQQIMTLLEGKAPKDSPAFTGAPTAPTAPEGTNTDQIATTAFVKANTAAPDHAHGNMTNDGKIGTTKDRPVFTGADGVLETKTPAAARTALGAAAADHTHTGYAAADHTHNDMTSVGEKYTMTVEPDTADKVASVIRIKDNASGDTRAFMAVNADASLGETSQISLRNSSNTGRIVIQSNDLGKKGLRIIDENGFTRVDISHNVNGDACTLQINDASGNDVTLDTIGAQPARLTYSSSIATSDWASDTTYPDYPYRATAVEDGEITEYMFAEVVLSPTDATSGNIAPVCETYAGGVYVYAKAVPDAITTIPTIIVWR